MTIPDLESQSTKEKKFLSFEVIQKCKANKNCHLTEFYKHSSVVYDGDENTLIYTPYKSGPSIDQLIVYLTLGVVIWYLTKSVCSWFQNNISDSQLTDTALTNIQSTQVDKINGTALQGRLRDIGSCLRKLESELAILPTKQRKAFHWLQFTLGEHRITLAEFSSSHEVRQNELEELEKNIDPCCRQLKEQLALAKQTTSRSSALTSIRIFKPHPSRVTDSSEDKEVLHSLPLDVLYSTYQSPR